MDLYTIRKSISLGKRLDELNLRVTYYSRVSTEHEEQKNSLRNQIDHFDEMIKSNTNWIYVPGYVDEGISGTCDTKRINFMRMISDARENKFDLIITKEISRFSRNTLDSIKYTRDLLDYGVAVFFLNDNINTALPDSELRLTIMASMAQDEVRRLSERVKFGMHRAIKNGNILGNDLMYGYKKDKVNKSLVINNEEAIVVKRLFSLYAISKLSLTKITKIFNDEGIRTSMGRKWNVTTLSRMIKNPKYKGFYCGRKSEVVDYMSKSIKVFKPSEWVMYEDNYHIPPIVDEYLFNLANKRLLSNSKSFGEKELYPLSSKILCSKCNHIFYKRKMNKKASDIVWFCSNKACNVSSIRESEIKYIIKDIFKLDEVRLKSILLDCYQVCDSNIDVIKNHEKEILDITLKKDKILELNLSGILSNEEFKIRNDFYNERIKCLKDEISKLKVCNTKSNLESKIDEYLESKVFIDNIINLIITKVSVNNVRNNKVILNLETKLKMDDVRCKTYEFKRGFDTIGTRRYFFYYEVYLN